MIDLKWALLSVVIISIGRRYLVRRIQNSEFYVRRQKLDALLNEQNQMSYLDRQKLVLPASFKVIIFGTMFGILIMLIFVIFYLSIIESDMPTIKIVFTAGYAGLMGYISTKYFHKINTYMYKHEEGIYKEIAENEISTVDYIKYPKMIIFIVAGVLLGVAII